MRAARERTLLCFFFVFFLRCALFAQTYNDGPIELRVRVREIQSALGSSDASFGFSPDDFTFKFWGRDNIGAAWQGGGCLISDFDPPGFSGDLNTEIFTMIYPGTVVPQFFEIKIDAWEDDLNADPLSGICGGYSRCNFDCCNICCGVIVFGNCVGIREGDDRHCVSDPFRTNMDYRLGPPCEWYSHGYVAGGCGSDYMPRIESYWRYIHGDNCATAIDIGTLTSGVPLIHENSTVCYANDYGDPGNDVFVRFTITQPMGVRVTTCGGATFNTTLFLLDENCNQLYSNLDASTCSPQSTIAENLCEPGNYYVVIDGSTIAEKGRFRLTIVEDPSLSLRTNVTIVDASCNGSADGSASASVTGGTAPYQYLWTPGNFITPSISGLAAGTYVVMVTDARSCAGYDTVVISEPATLTIDSLIGFDPVCNGQSTGKITVPLVSGGTSPYEYSVGGPFQPVSTFSFLAASTYTVTVRDGHGCLAAGTVTLNDPPRILGNLTSTPETCAGFSDGTISPNPSMGNHPYYCSLDFSPVFTVCTAVYSNLPAGTHYVTIRDGNNCEVTEPIDVLLVPALTGRLISKTNVSCHGGNDGAFTITSRGGTPPVMYSIDSGVTMVSDTVFTGLTAKLYTVMMQDANGCQNTFHVQIDEPTRLLPSELFQLSVTCSGEADGLMVITASGGTGPYRYSLDSVNFYPSGAFNYLSGGIYHFIVVDNNGCVATLDAVMHEPAVLAVNAVASTNASCEGINDGRLTLAATGGTPPFKYSINNGPFQSNATFTGLAAGTYLIGVEDRNDCVAFDSASVGANVSITAAVAKTDVLCNGESTGSITITGTSGTAPFEYSISNVLFQPSGTFSGLPAGSYTAITRDVNGCRHAELVNILEPPSLTAAVDSLTEASCPGIADGAIYITPSGGAGNYSFTWSNTYTSEDLVDVDGGNYSVTVRDANDCFFTLSARIDQPAATFAEITRIEDVSCFGESDGYVDLDVVGGVPPYTYHWSDNSSSQDLLDVPGGTYYLTVTDASGCEVYDTAVVREPAALASAITATGVSCSTSAEADIDLTVTGGTQPYDFFWSNFVFTEDQTDVPAGTYAVRITDDNGCLTTNSVTIASAPGLSATFNVTNVSCFGKADGQLEIIVSGGTLPYAYAWSNNQSTPIISQLGPGIYDVTVADATACAAGFSALVEEPRELKVQVSTDSVKCHGDNSGLAIPFVTGGTGANTFLWNTSPPSSNPVQTNLRGGTYILEVRDENDCAAYDTVTVYEPPKLSVTVAGAGNVKCLAGSDGEVTVRASGGTAPYQYSVRANRFQSDSVFTGLEAGDYGVMVIDGNGCFETASFTLTEAPGYTVDLPPYVFISLGASDTLKPVLIANDSIVKIEWMPPDFLSCSDCLQPVVTPAEDRSYTLVVTDINGCRAADEVTVVVKTEYEVFMPNIFSPNGDGSNDVFVPIDFGAVRTGTLKIFNRWGGLIYETRDFNAGWDGTFKGRQVNPGVFIYYISGEFLDGNTFSKTGSVTLIR